MDDKEFLKWIWAYNEHLISLDKSDALLIYYAKKGWNTPDAKFEFQRFITNYGLRRGKVGSYLKCSANEDHFIKLCHHFFKKALENDIFEIAQERWNKVQNLLEKDIGAKASSATLKFYWFYYPNKLPMYDLYTRKALQKIYSDKGINETNYLLAFKKFYNNDIILNIRAVEMYFTRTAYSYTRVAEKYLWLMGLHIKQRESILRKLKMSIELSPYKKLKY